MKAARTGGLPYAISLKHDQVSAEGRHTHARTHAHAAVLKRSSTLLLD